MYRMALLSRRPRLFFHLGRREGGVQHQDGHRKQFMSFNLDIGGDVAVANFLGKRLL